MTAAVKRNGTRIWIALALACCFALGGAASASASDVGADNNLLEIQGDNDDDSITLVANPTTVTITDTGTGGITAQINCNQVDGTTVTCPREIPGGGPVLLFLVFLGDGTDSFTNQSLDLAGQVSGQSTDPKTIHSGPGAQFIVGGTASDTIDGGPDDDTIFDGSDSGGPDGADAITGGDGVDGFQYRRSASNPVSVTLDGLPNDGAPGEGDNIDVENVLGGDGNDLLIGNGQPNSLAGGAGNDSVSGMGGSDEVAGEFAGGEFIDRALPNGPQNDDVLDGGAGRDDLLCGVGFDLAIHDALDSVPASCERTGAELASESASLGGKGNKRAKVALACPASEGADCIGTLTLNVTGKRVAKGRFSVPAGGTKRVKVKLTKKGAKVLKRAGGSALATASVLTSEPAGASENAGQLLLYR